MHFTTDRDYKAAKKILRGEKALPPVLRNLAEWMNATWQIQPVALFYESPARTNFPRLQVALLHTCDYLFFHNADQVNFSKTKQKAIAAQFALEVADRKATHKYPTENLHVYFTDFGHVARKEAAANIAQSTLRDFLRRSQSETVWQIQPDADQLMVFFHTEAQRQSPAATAITTALQQEYTALLKPHDEFGVIAEAKVMTDSRENFEEKYEGDWGRYWR